MHRLDPFRRRRSAGAALPSAGPGRTPPRAGHPSAHPLRRAGAWLIAGAGLLLTACAPAPAPPPLAIAPATAAPSLPADMSRPLRVFYSGHSLMDRPLPDRVESIAAAEGRPLQWERQYRLGSLLRERTRGPSPAADPWTGWTVGDNREGSGLDVAAALSGRIAGAEPYDVLVVTERHDILWAMQNESTALYLRRMHDERHKGRPEGQTWFYESWQSFSADRIAQWAAYETAAAGAWQCVAAEVNRSLQAEGRGDRVQSLPAARALSQLLLEATTSPGIPGLSGPTPRATVERLFKDAVHLNEAGFHYMALVTWAFVNGSPARAGEGPATPGVSPELDRALRAAAARAHERLKDQTRVEVDAARCQQQLAALCPVVWPYMATRWQDEGQSWPKVAWQQFKLQRQCDAAVRDGRHRLVSAGG